MPAYGYCVIAGHVAPNDRWEGFCPVCHRRLTLVADGERGELFLCVSSSFHSVGHMKAFHCSVFFVYPVLPSFLHGLLSPALAFVLFPDADAHTHTQRRLLVPVLSSQVPVGSGFSNVQMINGLRSLKALAAASSSIPPIPLILFLLPQTHLCLNAGTQTHTHIESATKC